MNEILTFQIGNYSNYIGTHYWNLQESQFVYASDYYGGQKDNALPDVNHDCLFREGVNKQNQLTFTPRAILIDLKDNINVFRSAYKFKSEVEIKAEIIKQNEKLEVYEAEKYESSTYLNDLDESERLGLDTKKKKDAAALELDEQVKYWSDYLKVKLHDRSYLLVEPHLVSVPPPSEEGEVNEPFSSFANGTNAAKDAAFSESMDESLRHFAEECNNIQGFQMFVDPFNGFGGISASLLQLVNEEYPKKPVVAFLSFPYFANKSKQAKLNRIINTSLTIKSMLYENKNLICVPMSLFKSPLSLKGPNDYDPVQISGIDYNPRLDYHTSGILASLADCVTSPYRQRTQRNYMNELLDLFDFRSYKIAGLQATFPLDLGGKYLLNYLQEKEPLCQESTWFTPYAHGLSDMEAKQREGAFDVCCKGIPDDRVKNIKDTFVFKPVEKAQAVVEHYFKETYPKSRSVSHSTTTPLNAGPPFPNIFSSASAALLPSKTTKRSSKDLKDISLMTILQMNQTCLGLVELLNANIRKENLVSDYRKCTEGIESDDLDELVEFNKELADLYSSNN